MSIQPHDNSDKSSEMPPKPDHSEFGEATDTDEVFGRMDEEGPNYRNVGFFFGCGMKGGPSLVSLGD